MTGYFDTMARQVRDVMLGDQGEEDPEEHARWEKLAAIEERVTWEVSIAVEQPGFPPALRREAHEVMLRRMCCAGRPLGARENESKPGTSAAFAHELIEMESALHTIFHALANSDPERWSDSPLQFVRTLAARGDNFRDMLVMLARFKTNPEPVRELGLEDRWHNALAAWWATYRPMAPGVLLDSAARVGLQDVMRYFEWEPWIEDEIMAWARAQGLPVSTFGA